jgi:sterol 14-demethylase
MTYEEFRHLPVMDSVIRETLRLHPPIHSMMRKVRDNIAVPPSLSAPSKDGTFIIPKGNYVLASPAVSQMDPQLWKDPAVWDPARWSDPEGMAAQALQTDESGEKVDYGFGAVSKGTESPYQPFGAGRHRCIGEQVSVFLNGTHGPLTRLVQFAYLQLGTLIATVIRRIEMRLDRPFPEPNYHVGLLSRSFSGYAHLRSQTMITLPKKPATISYRRRHAVPKK